MVIYVVAEFVTVLLWIMDMAMLLRAIISWFPSLDEAAWTDFVYLITDPIVVPVRAFFDRFELFRNSPIDFSFLIAWMLLTILQTIVSVMGGVFL